MGQHRRDEHEPGDPPDYLDTLTLDDNRLRTMLEPPTAADRFEARRQLDRQAEQKW